MINNITFLKKTLGRLQKQTYT